MRAPVLADSWWKRTVFGEVALYSLTGTLTSPKLIAPLQIARAIPPLYTRVAGGVKAPAAFLPSLTPWPAAAFNVH